MTMTGKFISFANPIVVCDLGKLPMYMPVSNLRALRRLIIMVLAHNFVYVVSTFAAQL